jgi:F-type H+-transporting ATPase subunit b
MPHKKIVILILILMPLLLGMSSAEEPSASNSKDFIGKVINFLILFGGLSYLLRKPLGNFLQGRARSLQNSIREARDSRQKAEEGLREVESRLEKMDKEIKEIRQKAEAESADLHKGIVQEADRDAERLRSLARQEIERLTRAGILEIREHMADLSTDLARRNILARMNEESQSSLIDRSIERLEKLYEKSDADQKIRAGSH